MLLDNKALLSLALAFPAALAAVLQDTSGTSYGGGHVDYFFNLANAYIQPVSAFPLLPSQYTFTDHRF